MKKLFVFVLFFSAANMNAKTICESKNENGYSFRVEFDFQHEEIPITLRLIGVSGEVIGTNEYRAYNMWDGHAAGLMTAPGLSIKYRNSYGRIHDVSLITVTDNRMGRGWVETATLGCQTDE